MFFTLANPLPRSHARLLAHHMDVPAALQDGSLPLHIAAGIQGSESVVRRLCFEHPEGLKERDLVRCHETPLPRGPSLTIPLCALIVPRPCEVASCAHSLTRSALLPPPHKCIVARVQAHNLPLHIACRQQRGVAVVSVLLHAFREGANEKDAVRGRGA